MGATIEYEIFDEELNKYVTLNIFVEEYILKELVEKLTGDKPENIAH